MMHGSLCIWQRDMKVLQRNLSSEAATVMAFPLTFFLTFGLGLKGYIQDIDGISYALFVVPGLISMTAILGAFDDGSWECGFTGWCRRPSKNTGSTDYGDRYHRGQDHLGFTSGFLKGLAVGVCFSAYRFPVQSLFLLAYLLFIFLGCIMFSCLGSLAGTLIDKPENLGRLEAVVVMPFIFWRPLLSPLRLPGQRAPYIKALPTTAFFDGARLALLTGKIDPVYLAELLASAVISFILAVRLFEKKMHA
jgi:lipooligosaccharide transport system permease protein